MRSFISALSTVALLASAYGAPGPASNPVPGHELLRRALKNTRSPLPQSVPFTIDADFCLWNPNGDCFLNLVAIEIYDYVGVVPPVYEYTDYADDEGVYAYDGDAYEAYLAVLYDLYDVINAHAPYEQYDYDAQTWIAGYDDEYCVWKYEGGCWFNDLVKYFDDLWEVPYKKGRVVRRQQENWSVYATSDGIQLDYATFALDLLKAIDANGPLDLDLSSLKL